MNVSSAPYMKHLLHPMWRQIIHPICDSFLGPMWLSVCTPSAYSIDSSVCYTKERGVLFNFFFFFKERKKYEAGIVCIIDSYRSLYKSILSTLGYIEYAIHPYQAILFTPYEVGFSSTLNQVDYLTTPLKKKKKNLARVVCPKRPTHIKRDVRVSKKTYERDLWKCRINVRTRS